MKICKICKEEKQLDSFFKKLDCRFGVSNWCKLCDKERIKKYEKTIDGFVMRMYRNMKSRIRGIQKQKFHLYKGKYLLDKETFYAWIKNNKTFYELFRIYEDSGYERRLAPSVDRIDSDKGYVLDNMEVITMSENSRRGSLSKKRIYNV